MLGLGKTFGNLNKSSPHTSNCTYPLTANARLALARFIHAKAKATILRVPPVLFIDNSVIVVNKYSGFECQPAKLNPHGSFDDVLKGELVFRIR